MKLLRTGLISMAVISALIIPAVASADPSGNFYEEGDHVFDDWDVCRTRAAGQDGFFQLFSGPEFRPVITFESLGENADIAYQLGREFAGEYSDLHQRAEAIFAYARDKVRYSSDSDQFDHSEFAQNADEMAGAIKQNGVTYGDCEDYAILLAVMYKGAGHRSAILLTPGHAAALVYLPEYKKANQRLSVNDESGWVWAEATGGNNRLGWMPEQYIGKSMIAYEVTGEAIVALEKPEKPPATVTQKKGKTGFRISPFFGVIIFMWLLPLFRRRH
jgi:transglutaminase-like putative cysteine protease